MWSRMTSIGTSRGGMRVEQSSQVIRVSRATVPLLVVAIVLTACGPADSAERRAVAEAAARQFLAAVSTDSPDRGWSLIDEVNQEQWQSKADYLATAADADWATFEVISVATQRCEEGYACRVCIDVAVPGDIPVFLLSEDNRSLDGLVLLEKPQDCGDAILLVLLEPIPGMLDGVAMAPHSGE